MISHLPYTYYIDKAAPCNRIFGKIFAEGGNMMPVPRDARAAQFGLDGVGIARDKWVVLRG
jgi:hypothetical protein